MGIFCGNAAGVEKGDFFPVKQQVSRVVFQMTAFYQYVFRAHCMNGTRRLLHCRKVRDFQPCNDFRLRQVGCYDIRQRQEPFDKRFFCFRLHEVEPAFGNHYGVYHDVIGAVLFQFIRNGVYGFNLGNHADFDRADWDIRKNCVNLPANDFRCDILTAEYALCILYGYGGYDAHAVCSLCGKCFQVCLYACAAAGIRTGDCQYMFHV